MGLKDQASREGTFDGPPAWLVLKLGSGDNKSKYSSRKKGIGKQAKLQA